MTIDNAETLKRLKTIFLDTFTDDNCEFSPEATQQDVGDWDSLNQIRLLTAIEQEFGFQFDIGEIEYLTSVSALVNSICAKTARLSR